MEIAKLPSSHVVVSRCFGRAAYLHTTLLFDKMRSINLGGGRIIDGNKDDVYIIAEIGQNHQGSVETAKRMIAEAKKSGCNCVKFQKSDLESKFTKAALNRKYESENSWGVTYGDHKKYLEFSEEQFLDLQKFCEEIQIDFTASAMDEKSLLLLENMGVPFIKIGSGDANNFPLLKKAANLHTPLLISTGMQSLETIDRIVDIMRDYGKSNFALLHCVSSYPTQPIDCHLQTIATLLKRYSVVVGYSGHETGIDISKAAVLFGAKIIERHFTLDKAQKGSDHKCSLDPFEMRQLVRDILVLKDSKMIAHIMSPSEVLDVLNNKKEVELALKNFGEKEVLQCELPCKLKLGKSIVACVNLKSGHVLRESDIAIKVSEPNGIPAELYYEVIGSIILTNVGVDEPIIFEYLKK